MSSWVDRLCVWKRGREGRERKQQRTKPPRCVSADLSYWRHELELDLRGHDGREGTGISWVGDDDVQMKG